MNTGFIPPYSPRPVLPTEYAAIAIVVDSNSRILIARRRSGFLAGCWEFPGGKREAGESYAACAIREVREEMGIEVESVRELLPIRHEYESRRVILQPYVCRIVSGAPPETSALRWVQLSELISIKMPEANQTLIARLLANPELLSIE